MAKRGRIRRTRPRQNRRRRRRNNAFLSTKINIPVNPIASELMPWNSCVIQRMAEIDPDKVPVAVTSGYIYDSLIKQLAITSPILSVRLIAFSVYDLAGRALQLNIYDPIGGAVIGNAIDYPGRNGWSRVKLTWPKAISANPLPLKTNEPAKIADVSVTKDTYGTAATKTKNILVKVHVLWRVNAAVAPSVEYQFEAGASDTPIKGNDHLSLTDNVVTVAADFDMVKINH